METRAARLMEQSEKAKENGAAYAKHTCERAAKALSRREPQNKPPYPKIGFFAHRTEQGIVRANLQISGLRITSF